MQPACSQRPFSPNIWPPKCVCGTTMWTAQASALQLQLLQGCPTTADHSPAAWQT
jgi:hypothetical protein